jgi:hypothetical protein
VRGEDSASASGARHGGDPDFRLCDYCDLIAGNSTRVVIAAALSVGMSVDEVREHYIALDTAPGRRLMLITVDDQNAGYPGHRSRAPSAYIHR